MIRGALFSVFLFAVLIYSTSADQNTVATDPQTLIQPILSRIENSFAIDTMNPPFYDTEWAWEPTCIEYFGKCTHAAFFHRHLLVEGKPDVTYTSHIETAQVNSVHGESRLSMKSSTSVTDFTTTGWTIGAKLSIQGGTEEAKGGAEVSATYSNSATTSNTYTKEFVHEAPCDPGSECRIETWTFHVEVDGLCKSHGMINCRDFGTWDQCADPGRACAQFNNFYERNCLEISNPACKVKTPVFDDTGKPVSHIVIVSESLEATKKRSELEPSMPQVKYQIIG